MMFKKIRTLFTKKREQPEVEQILNNIKSRIAKSNGYAIEQFSLPKPKPNTDVTDDYLNKSCTDLKDFIISPEINQHDLKMLCKLNNIDLQVASGWHKMLIAMLIELDNLGWDRKVTCIKEKYASLKFYCDSQYKKIAEKYEHISEKTCETCGEKGNKRYNTGWDYVACRKHYLENKGSIKSSENGFELNGKPYLWSDILDATFEDHYTVKNDLVTFTFSSNMINHNGMMYDKLHISRGTAGYGEFLKSIPRRFRSLDRVFLNEYCKPSACLICGFIAVYNHVCECCDNDEWLAEVDKHWDKEDYIAIYQSGWIEDEGPEYAGSYGNYLKDEHYKIISRPTEQ